MGKAEGHPLDERHRADLEAGMDPLEAWRLAISRCAKALTPPTRFVSRGEADERRRLVSRPSPAA